MTPIKKPDIYPGKEKLNPLAYHLNVYLRKHEIRHIILYGGSSSGKSYSTAQMLLLFTMKERSNTLVFRKVGASISNTIYQDFKTAASQLNITQYFRFIDSRHQIKCCNGAVIDFKGLDDEEKIKGISSYKRIFMDEWNEFDESDDDQINFRLRGQEGQQIIHAFNPVSDQHWIKTKRFDTEKWHDISMIIPGKENEAEYTKVKSIKANEPKQIYNPHTRQYEEHPSDTIAIQTTYLNNFWVVGSPCGTFGYYDRQCIANFERTKRHRPDLYEIYALGEWGRLSTGTEFFSSFHRGDHTKTLEYNPTLPIHISVDNNFLPYITTTFWQIDLTDGTHIGQIDEVLASPPFNDVRKSAKLVADKLKEYHGKISAPQDGNLQVILHGDASTRAANTIDEEKRSFLDLFIDTLVKEGIDIEDNVGNKNPSVPMSGQFINAIFDSLIEDVSITIGDNCKTSIDDYLAVQKDVNGAILKTREKNKTTGQTYEKQGHISDTFRYIVCDVLADEFTLFTNKRKRNLYAQDEAISYYNPSNQFVYTGDVVYCMPNVGGRFCMLHAKKCGELWHIVNADLREEDSAENIKKKITDLQSPLIVMECSKSYFPLVRELREIVPEVRVLKEQSDIDRRISATSDFVKSHIRFNDSKIDSDPGYSSFINSLLDYNPQTKDKVASAVLSGFIKYALKSHFSE